MKIALFGASGTIGRRILSEALSRGHEVTAIVRDPSRLAEPEPRLRTQAWDILDPAVIEPGERTGTSRLGETALLADAQGQSRISAEDYAIALLDELERPQHIRRQFTAAY